MKHPVDNLFRKEMVDYEVPVSSALWDTMEEKLDGSKKAQNQRWYAIASCVVLLMAGYWFILENRSGKIISERAAVAMQGFTIEEVPEMPKSAPVTRKAQPIVVAQKETIKAREILAKVELQEEETFIPGELEGIGKTEISLAYTYKKTLPLIDPGNSIKPSDPDLLDRVVQAAHEVKRHGGFLAEMRELKDDILTLQFLTQKKSI